MHYPKTMQHTHAKWEQVFPETVETKAQHMLSGKIPSDQVDENGSVSHEHDRGADTLFTPLPAHVARNFMVVDTYARGPPTSTFGVPGSSGSVVDVGPPGLTDISEDVIAMLPDESRKALLKIREEVRTWQSRWTPENQSKMRAEVHIAYNT